jgi:hypothetical protein
MNCYRMGAGWPVDQTGGIGAWRSFAPFARCSEKTSDAWVEEERRGLGD